MSSPTVPRPPVYVYCINSAALLFIPVADLEKEVYGDYVALFEDARKTADGE